MNAANKKGWTPLHAAAVRGHEVALVFLLARSCFPFPFLLGPVGFGHLSSLFVFFFFLPRVLRLAVLDPDSASAVPRQPARGWVSAVL